jgi:CubicO group peptidase (beta-lactamase class C family)
MPGFDQVQLKARVDEIRSRWPAVGLAVGVVQHGGLESFCGQGFADIAAKTPVTQDTVFRIASISKTFTAIAVMQLWERGLVDLDGPANDYLRAYRLIPAHPSWRPATVRQLLTHTAGIPEWVHPLRMVNSGWFGESFDLRERLPTLAEYYHGALRLTVEPGTICTYSDHGFATLGQVVEDVSGWALDRYFAQHIFRTLGMEGTDLQRSERIQANLATGYRLGSKGAKALTDRQWVTSAASSIYSTPRDMARYVAALLGGGAGERGTILKPETLAVMFKAHYQTDPRIPGMGLSFFRIDMAGHAVVEHQGVLPGFNSQIFLAPDDGVGVVAFTNGSRNAATWLTAETGRLLGDVIGAPTAAIRTDVSQHPETWGDLCGWYRPRAQRTDMQAWSVLGAGVEVLVRHGRLMLRTLSPVPILYRGVVLHPDDDTDPDVFRIDLSRYGMAPARVVFSRNSAGATTGVHLDGLPLSAEKRSALANLGPGNPGLLATGALAAVAMGTAARPLRRRATPLHVSRR